MALLFAVIPKLKDLYDRYLDAYNVHLTITPTTHLPAGPIDQVQPWVLYNDRLVDTFDAYGQTVLLGPPLGIPAISIPIGLSTDGLPLGIHLQARPGMLCSPCLSMLPVFVSMVTHHLLLLLLYAFLLGFWHHFLHVD